MSRTESALFLVALLALANCRPGETEAPPPSETAPSTASAETGRCDHYTDERQVFWGDLHVHTAISLDAYLFQTGLRPDDAYRFARGEAIDWGADEPIQLERPLDFTAVTDHANNMGTVTLCSTPGSPSYDSEGCAALREPLELPGEGSLSSIIRKLLPRLARALTNADICGEDGARCRRAAGDAWRETQEAAARWNDESSACEFSTFVVLKARAPGTETEK